MSDMKRSKPNHIKGGSAAKPELVNACGVVFSNDAAETGVEDAAVNVSFGDGLDLQADDGWIDVRDYVRLTLTGLADGQDQTVTVTYRTHDDDAGDDLVPATVLVVADGRTPLLTAENIEHVSAIKPLAKHTSADGGTLNLGGNLK